MPGPAAVLAGSDTALFASDMHLGDHDRATAAMFLDALAREAAGATHLFLLGDLFEAWVGDDQPDEVVRQALARFAGLVAAGKKLHVMRGNRDFLLDRGPRSRFSGATGATMLEDPCTVRLFGEIVVLAHGDALCTADHEYQAVRSRVRSAEWQARFLARSLDERLAIARELREQSERSKATRGGPDGDPASDVTPLAVEALLADAGARVLIHGHTHRPGRHAFPLAGRAAERWVLSDWDAREGRGDFLRVDARGFTRLAASGRALSS